MKKYKATWTLAENPLYHIKCPHCKSVIIMSSPKVIERLKNWAKKLKI